MRSLHEIGLEKGTDKATFHLFTILYDYIFSPIRKENLKLLEVGIYEGSSLKMWEEYFYNGKIYGADVFDYKFLENDRINTLLLNQENESDLKSVDNDFDIIIDDGGHTMLQQQLSLKILFTEKLKSGGYYILEDLHTSDPFYINGNWGEKFNNNTLLLMENLKNKKWSENNNFFINYDDFLSILNNISSIEIFRVKYGSITSIIRKK